jgi:protein-tyrosine phosphatase
MGCVGRCERLYAFDMSSTTGVLFVCLGNICRSPLAKVVFTHHARTRGVLDRFRIDSCGTGSWHVGGPADPRTVDVAREMGLSCEHVVRQFNASSDAESFEYILAMDRDNKRTLLAHGAPPERVRMMRSFDPTLVAAGVGERDLDVPDPYQGGPEGFREVYRMLDRASIGLLEHLLRMT